MSNPALSFPLRQRPRHRLLGVIDIVEPAVDDRPTHGLEPADIERDVVVNQKDRARAARAGIGDVGEHVLERIRVEVAAAHFDDRAEAAVEGAAARRLDDVDRTAEQSVAGQHARRAIRQAEIYRA